MAPGTTGSISNTAEWEKIHREQSVTERVNKQIYRRHLAFLYAQVINIFCDSVYVWAYGNCGFFGWYDCRCKRSGSSLFFVSFLCFRRVEVERRECNGRQQEMGSEQGQNLNEIHVFCLHIFRFRYRRLVWNVCYHLSLICSRSPSPAFPFFQCIWNNFPLSSARCSPLCIATICATLRTHPKRTYEYPNTHPMYAHTKHHTLTAYPGCTAWCYT